MYKHFLFIFYHRFVDRSIGTPGQANDEAQVVVQQASGGRARGGRGGGGGGSRGGGGSAGGGGGARHGDPHGVDSGDDSDRCERR